MHHREWSYVIIIHCDRRCDMSLSNFLSFFQSLLEAHDMVASKCYEVPPPAEVANDAAVNNALMQADAVRMIGIRKKAGEPLVSGT